MNIKREEHQQHERRSDGDAHGRTESAPFTRVAILTAIALFLLLRFPAHPNDFTFAQISVIPIEWFIIIAILGLATRLLTRRSTGSWCAAIVAILGLLLLLRILDLGSYLAFDRRFSPLLEWHLIGDGWHLASTSIGLVPALVIVVASVLVLALLCLALYRGLMALGRLSANTTVIACAAIAAVVGAAWLFQNEKAPVSAAVLPELADRIEALQRSVADQREFAEELEQETVDPNAPPRFAALQGRDLVVVFIESYGRSFLAYESLQPRAEAMLEQIQANTLAAGLHARSGWVESPIRGGRSWLAHSSFAAGLRVDNQARYDRLVTSSRKSLYSLLSEAGWTTFGLLPAIQKAWPEGSWYGFDDLRNRDGMDYQGEPFGYVTMPDQYSLSAFEANMRHSTDGDVAAEIALLSSHVPWNPLPRGIPWEDVGDGSVFDGSHRFGGPMNWRDRDSVRDAYATSLEYSLSMVGEYASLFGEGSLMIVLGDHQPTSIIAGWGKTADTPIHFISDDAQLLDRLPTEYFVDGMVPDQNGTSLPMWSMRELLTTAFETP